MPLREFICNSDHVTEKVLQGDADTTTLHIACPHPVIFSLNGNIACGKLATRLDTPTRTAIPRFVRGSGGFYGRTSEPLVK